MPISFIDVIFSLYGEGYIFFSLYVCFIRVSFRRYDRGYTSSYLSIFRKGHALSPLWCRRDKSKLTCAFGFISFDNFHPYREFSISLTVPAFSSHLFSRRERDYDQTIMDSRDQVFSNISRQIRVSGLDLSHSSKLGRGFISECKIRRLTQDTDSRAVIVSAICWKKIACEGKKWRSWMSLVSDERLSLLDDAREGGRLYGRRVKGKSGLLIWWMV